MGGNQSKSETINWKDIKTNDFSSTLPKIDGISSDAKLLVAQLTMPEMSETSSEFNVNNLFDRQKLVNPIDVNNLSESSSPFITSEMYNTMLNKYHKPMVGGGNNTTTTSEAPRIKNTRRIKNESTENSTLSYVSSSAHTGGGLSESASVDNINSSTVHTSDINMISDN